MKMVEDFGLEVVEIKGGKYGRHSKEVYLTKNAKATVPNILNISSDLAEKLPWLNNERLNFLAKKDSALFGLTPHRTGLVTLKANGNAFRINNVDLCTTIRARTAMAGYGEVTEYNAWIAGDILMFAPKEEE